MTSLEQDYLTLQKSLMANKHQQKDTPFLSPNTQQQVAVENAYISGTKLQKIVR